MQHCKSKATVYFNVELNNVRQRWSLQHWAKSKQRCKYHHLKKKASSQKQDKIFELHRIHWTQNLLYFFTLLKGIYKRIFAEPQKFLKHRIYWITKTTFKLSHLVKCQSVFKVFLKILQNSEETTCAGVSLRILKNFKNILLYECLVFHYFKGDFSWCICFRHIPY